MQPVKRYLLLSAYLAAVMFFATTGLSAEEQVLEDRTMGTTYHVKVVADSVAGLKEKIDRRLDEIDRSMSVYREDSEISRFNRFRDVNVDFPISQDFWNVMKVAARVYALSEGAWDGTVSPLVDLWGFGRSKAQMKPSMERIKAALADVGFDKVVVSDHKTLMKRTAGVNLVLGLTHGYGVEQVSELLRQAGYRNYLVEIGGEIVAVGTREDGRPWRIGIGSPRGSEDTDAVYGTITLRDRAVSTGGDYHNFFTQDGVRYSHVIDPKSGYPVSNGVVSATIIADDCTLADGLGTAVMVMGPEKGMALIKRLKGVEGLVVVEESDGTLHNYKSDGFHMEP
jgi:FAD:protein FMN transferase